MSASRAMPHHRDSSNISIRDYRYTDAEATLRVFLQAVRQTASRDYSPQQIAAWTGGEGRTLPVWNGQMQARNSFVAIAEDAIVGFSDVSDEGLIDMLFVAPTHTRRGVASRLLREALRRATERGAARLTAHASITARPFFDCHGFTVVTEQHPVIDEISLTNYLMVKNLPR